MGRAMRCNLLFVPHKRIYASIPKAMLQLQKSFREKDKLNSPDRNEYPLYSLWNKEIEKKSRCEFLPER